MGVGCQIRKAEEPFLKWDTALQRSAIEKDPQALRFADEQARADKEIVLAAVTQAG